MRLILVLVFALYFQNIAASAELSSEEAIRAAIARTFPDIDITRIRKTPVEGLFEVLLGPDLIYTSGDGRYIFQGDLIDIKLKRNLSEDQRAKGRQKLLSNISPNDYIEYASKNLKHTVYVFTDIDCGYCRRLHKDMPELNKRGIAVRYLAFPRSGIGTKTSEQMESVWCATNRAKAMNEAKQGMRVSKKSCANPVSRQFTMGRDMGVRGTPAIFTEHGQSISGYMPPDKLLQALNSQ